MFRPLLPLAALAIFRPELFCDLAHALMLSAACRVDSSNTAARRYISLCRCSHGPRPNLYAPKSATDYPTIMHWPALSMLLCATPVTSLINLQLDTHDTNTCGTEKTFGITTIAENPLQSISVVRANSCNRGLKPFTHFNLGNMRPDWRKCTILLYGPSDTKRDCTGPVLLSVPLSKAPFYKYDKCFPATRQDHTGKIEKPTAVKLECIGPGDLPRPRKSTV